MTRKRKGWERKMSTTKQSPSTKEVPVPQAEMCTLSTETHQGKESKKSAFLNLNALNCVLCFILIVWLYAYLGCGYHLNSYLGYPANPDIVANAVGLFRAWLNFGMVSIVILFTYLDRWKIFKEAISNNLANAEFKNRVNSLFIPFALATIPFITAASDLGDLLSLPNLTYYLLMAFLLLLIVLDGIVTAVFVKKFPDKNFKRILSGHILAFFYIIIAAFVIAVLSSFPFNI